MRAYKLLLIAGIIVVILAIKANRQLVNELTSAAPSTIVPTHAPRATPTQYFGPLGTSNDSALEMEAHNPTWSEMITFLNNNKINWREGNKNYDCLNFACDLQREAFENGIRCALVLIDYPSNGHAIVAFETTDKGLVYIEPQFDLPVKITVGKSYMSWFCGDQCRLNHNDIVLRISTEWGLSLCSPFTS